MTAKDIMEQDYWKALQDFRDNAVDFMSVVNQNEKDLMNTTKTFMQRIRLNRDIQFNEDFRKKHITREYGNYEKYENNKIEEEVESATDDNSIDIFSKNMKDMHRRLDISENEKQKKIDEKKFVDVISNENYSHKTF